MALWTSGSFLQLMGEHQMDSRNSFGLDIYRLMVKQGRLPGGAGLKEGLV